MPAYLPLCTFREELLSPACQACAWWQTTGSGVKDPSLAGYERRRWLATVEPAWGSTGLLLAGDGHADASTEEAPATPEVVASISYAPVRMVPRWRDLGLGNLPTDAVLVFCLKSDGSRSRPRAKRLLQKALGQLRGRGLKEAYAVAARGVQGDSRERCRFFSVDFLEANGFRRVRDSGRLVLMRVELRTLLSLVGQLETIVRRLLGSEPAPSPAAWTRRGAH